MNKNRPVVGFDLDGTLVPCHEKQVYALQKAAESLNVRYGMYDRFWDLKRNGATTFQALCGTGVESPIADRLAQRWIELIETWECICKDRVMPGVVDSLRELSSHADLLLLSARQDAFIFDRQIITLGLKQHFQRCQAVPVGRSAVAAKASYLRQHEARCYIGDTESDAEAAAEANIPIYLVSSGQRSEYFLRGIAGPNVKIFSSVNDAASEAMALCQLPTRRGDL